MKQDSAKSASPSLLEEYGGDEQAACRDPRLADSGRHRDYWLSRPPAERLQGMELLRRQQYGIEACTGKMIRVIEVVSLFDSPVEPDHIVFRSKSD